jgi:hypothetical protein
MDWLVEAVSKKKKRFLQGLPLALKGSEMSPCCCEETADSSQEL